MLSIETAKVHAAKITQGVATYARFVDVDGVATVQVRVRTPNYRIAWVDCWIESGRVYGEW